MKRSLLRAFLALFLAVAGPIVTGPSVGSAFAQSAPAAAPSAAQTPAQPVVKTLPKPEPSAKVDDLQMRLDSLKAEIDQIHAGVQRDGQSDKQLADMRGRVDVIRKAADEIEAAEAPRAAAIDARLKQLAPSTPVKEDEAAPIESGQVKAEREDQQKLFAEVQGRVKQAQLLRLRSDEIIKAIAEKRGERFARQMLDRSRSILDPSLWLEALQAVPVTFQRLSLLIGDWLGLMASRGAETAIAIGSVVLALLAVSWRARRRLSLFAERDLDLMEPPLLRRAASAVGIVALNVAVPTLGLLGLSKALDVFDLNPARIDQFLEAIAVGVGSAAAIYGIALALLAPGKPQWRLAPMSDQTASRLFNLFVVLSFTHGFGVMLLRILDVLAAPVAEIIALSGLFAIIDALVVMLALKATARALAGEEDDGVPKVEEDAPGRSMVWRWVIPIGWVGAIGAIVAVATGYVALGAFVTQQMVRTGFLLGALRTLLLLADEMIMTAFQERTPLGRILTRSMGFTRETVEQVGVVLSGLARLTLIALAALAVLAPIGLDSQDVVSDAKAAFFGFKIGGLTFSLSTILSGVIFLVIGVGVTRGVQGWLDQRLLPRTRLDVGLKNSIRTAFGYVGYVLAVMLAFSVVGLDLQNLAIVAGALSVGIGFGLQSIVNNFVSGLILLVERPIKAGDLVEIGSEKGFVRKINVRSTEIETFDRASLIVPNSSLISGTVKNWMHRDLSGRCVVDIGVAYDADPERVKVALLDCAAAHAKVQRFPAPSAFFTNFGESALEFRLVCTVANVNDAFGVESDLRFAIAGQLRELGIDIPYAQRDIHIRQLDDLGGLVEAFLRGRPEVRTGGGLPETDA